MRRSTVVLGLAYLLGACAYDASGVEVSGAADLPGDPDPGEAPADAAPPPDAAPPRPPDGVKFKTQVVGMLFRRGCGSCHSDQGVGQAAGGLKLDGDPHNVYKELTQEVSPNYHTTRIDLTAPAASLLLRMPLAENPPDPHPISPFLTTSDPDYLLLLGWIAQGGKDN